MYHACEEQARHELRALQSTGTFTLQIASDGHVVSTHIDPWSGDQPTLVCAAGALEKLKTNAPAGQRATWFALMASLMNLALVAGQLQTKYLNHALTVGRGDYQELGLLLITVTVLGLVVPVAAIAVFGRRV